MQMESVLMRLEGQADVIRADKVVDFNFQIAFNQIMRLSATSKWICRAHGDSTLIKLKKAVRRDER